MIHIDLPPLAITLTYLLVRAVLAVAFLLEFQIKAKNIRAFAKNDGLPVPVAVFVATAELAAALSFISGILTQLAALGVMLLMLCTMSLHIFKWHSPYKAGRGGWEYDLLLFTLAAVVVTGN
jgi:putative oxidoreductase